ncbi:tripartite tricarboxylate transporter substrate-binding protein [Piscinibacter sakaiensis]|uniref:tripartite tricarboxylate transporter substrate-binding protein n=1 Tax=Piscinibacter sakaiensis TaxID=1547922 RepID=UPI003AB0FE42
MKAAVSGEVPLTWAGIPSSRQHIQSGRIKALAYGGKKRTPVFPDVPTVGELGYPEIDANVWVGLFAPAGMNPEAAVIARPSMLVGNRGALRQPTRRGEMLAAALGQAAGFLIPANYSP